MTLLRQGVRAAGYWVVPVLLFTLLRLPTLTHQPGMQDEQWFAVPGYTVWKEGIPRIPYLPERNRDAIFENADVCLMALPPGLFYAQAPFFSVFPAGYPTARVPLFIAAIVTVGLVYWIVKRLGGTDFAGGVAALLVAISRPLLFTAVTARPDLLSALFGWLSIIAAWEMLRRKDSIRLALLSGASCGLAGLFHPFALVFALQGGVAMLLGEASAVTKMKRLAAFAIGNLLLISLWIPLIVAFPVEFQSQFFANVLDRAGPGLLARLVWPFPSLIHHARLLVEFAGPLQSLLMAAAMIYGTLRLKECKTIAKQERYGVIALVWSSVYLTATVAGVHPTKGYWVYPFLWIVAIGIVVMTGPLTDNSVEPVRITRTIKTAWQRLVCLALIVIAFLPGAGFRTTWIYWSNWRDPTVYAPGFVAQVLEELPSEGVFYADLSYVFDVYLSDRQTQLCVERDLLEGDAPIDYDFLLLSWQGEDARWADQYHGQLVRQFGSRRRPQDCFVNLYRPERGDAVSQPHSSSTGFSEQ